MEEIENKNYDFAKAEKRQELLEYVLPYANAGDADAQVEMGFLYSTGTGVPRDLSEAERWLMKAAEQDHPLAWNNLGTLFQERDQDKAKQCYRRAVELGFLPASVNLE